jgi:hypothetical protein
MACSGIALALSLFNTDIQYEILKKNLISGFQDESCSCACPHHYALRARKIVYDCAV